jgi:hypothetical protein
MNHLVNKKKGISLKQNMRSLNPTLDGTIHSKGRCNDSLYTKR